MRIALMGQMLVESRRGEKLSIRSKKSRALLAALVIAGEPGYRREKLAHLLWSDTATTFGKTNLRQCLSLLRKDLQDTDAILIQSEGDTLRLNQAEVSTDVWELTAALQAAVLAPSPGVHSARGLGLLEDFPEIDAEFDRWLVQQQRCHHRLVIEALVALQLSSDSGDHKEHAIRYATAILGLEPAHEATHRFLINAFAERGDRQAACLQYQHCVEALDQHLDLEPAQATIELIKKVRLNTPAEQASPITATLDRVALLSNAAADQPVHHPRLTSLNAYRYLSFVGLLSLGLVLLVASLTGMLPYAQQDVEDVVSDKSQAALTATTQGSVAVNGLTRVESVHANDANETPAHEPSIATLPAVKLPAVASLSARISLAILPFRNLGAEVSQQYLSDGLSEDLLTELSRVSGLRVVASHSSFAFRQHIGETATTDSIDQSVVAAADALAVDYLLMGSVRRERERLRINAQLLRVRDSTYLWTERFDREFGDVLQVQDEITRSIVASLSVQLTEPEWRRLSRARYISPDAYDMLLRGLHPFSQFTSDGIELARGYFKRAIALDGDYARPYANLALSIGREVVFGLSPLDPQQINEGLHYADQAERRDPSLPQTQFARAVLYLARRDHQQAIAAARKSIDLDSSYADGYAVLAQTLGYRGELGEALEAIEVAKYLNPLVPFTYNWVEGHLLFQLGRFDEARGRLVSVYESNPSFLAGLLTLAATYGHLDMQDEAGWIAEEILTHNPDFSVHRVTLNSPYQRDVHRKRLQNGLRKAGLPG